MGAVFIREIQSYFQAITGFIFLGLFLLFAGIIFVMSNLWPPGSSDFRGTLSFLTFIFLIGVPILTMRLLSEEARQKTDQLLLTSPVPLVSIVVGKYLAALALLTAALAVTGIYPALIGTAGLVVRSELICAYLGVFLLGASLISVGLFVSSLTENQVSAAFLTFGALLLIWAVDWIVQAVPRDRVAGLVFLLLVSVLLAVFVFSTTRSLWVTLVTGVAALAATLAAYGAWPSAFDGLLVHVLVWFSLVARFGNFTRGVLALGPVLYYVSFVATFLFLTVRVIDRPALGVGGAEMKISRNLRFGGYASLVTVAVIVLVAGINLVVDKVPWRADMTVERFYSLSDQTQKVVAALRTPVAVLELWEAGKEDPKVAELLQRYQTRTTMLQVRQVDPYRSPVELKKYTANGNPPDAGSVIFDAGGRFRILRTADMYTMTQDQTTGEQVPTSFVGESAITNAIASVTAARDPVVYFLQGHGEKDLQPLLADKVKKAFYDVRVLTLATTGDVPADADMVVDVAPQQDWVPEEEQALLSYLRDRGGKLFLMADLGASAQPVMGRLLESFGLAFRPWLVVERAANQFLPNQPYVLIPNVGSHAITAPNAASSLPILFPVSQVLQQLPAVRRTVQISPLLVSSSKSYAKVDLQDASGDQGARDPNGPFVLAAAVTDTGEVGEKPSRMVVMASSHYIFPTENMGRLEENENLFMNSLGWLQDRPELISIPPRAISGNRYAVNISQLQFILFGGIAVLLVPLGIFAAALVTWLRRRHL